MADFLRAISTVPCTVLGIAVLSSSGHAQSRAECEAGIAFVRNAEARQQASKVRINLGTALLDIQRELGESDYDECQRAVEDARAALVPVLAADLSYQAKSALGDERVSVDRDFPVSPEGAGVPERGELEVRLLAGYSRLRSLADPSSASGNDDDAGPRRYGRDLTTPAIEAELGVGYGLSASAGLVYAFGNTEDARTGEAELGMKWNVLPPEGLQPAVTVLGGVSMPFGPRHGTPETVLGLLASQPLSRSSNAPVLHGNILWFHALDRKEDERKNRYALAVALGVPVARSTGVFVGYSREQDSERRRADQFIELGARQLLQKDLVLAAGIGIGVGDSETDFWVLIGLQRNF